MKYTFDGKMNPSDMKFYQNMREQKEFNVDHSKIQEYFPINVVIDGTFKIYQVIVHFFLELIEPYNYLIPNHLCIDIAWSYF